MTVREAFREYFRFWMLFPAPLFVLSIWAGAHMVELAFSTEGDLWGGCQNCGPAVIEMRENLR